ncbi:MAG: hypothetical protein QOJ65_2014 [Fimbriimonadaceae bacterium]|jgi:hypothetical protein|nr:hypothetical protein [Fimbriimonadaceae bacterium]
MVVGVLVVLGLPIRSKYDIEPTLMERSLALTGSRSTALTLARRSYIQPRGACASAITRPDAFSRALQRAIRRDRGLFRYLLKSSDEKVRIPVIMAVAKAGMNDEVPTIAPYLSNASFEVRVATVRALTWIEPAYSNRYLLDALTNTSLEVRGYAGRELITRHVTFDPAPLREAANANDDNLETLIQFRDFFLGRTQCEVALQCLKSGKRP